MSRRSLSVALVAALVTASATVAAVAAGAAPAPIDDGLASDPAVAAAQQRVDAAAATLEQHEATVESGRVAEAELASVVASIEADRGVLDLEIAEVGEQERAALDLHERTRRSYVDAAVAAYVAGAPASLELKASMIEEPVDRARSMAFAESVGDVFSKRAQAVKRTGDALTGELRGLAAERAEVTTVLDAAQRDLDGARRHLADAEAAVAAASGERDAAATALEVERAAARERIAQAAERFRLGAIDIAELRRMGDDRVAVADVPVRAYDAYVTAARAVDAQQPGCRVSWWALAAIGKIETRHGSYGGGVILPNGDVAPRILGPRLTGGAFATVTDSDGGRYDGDTEYDRAVGPMQFIPSTWVASGADGNGDGVADPHNYYDAALAAARYLCRGARGLPLDSVEGMRAAALSYNRSQVYADKVLEAARSYGGLGGAPVAAPG